MARPLWEVYFVEGLEGGRVALLSKSHQILVDGISTVDLGQVLLDVDPVLGLRRAGDSPDRIEAESLEFHRRVREGFLELAGQDAGRYLVVAADAPVPQVHEAVRTRLAALVPEPQVVRA